MEPLNPNEFQQPNYDPDQMGFKKVDTVGMEELGWSGCFAGMLINQAAIKDFSYTNKKGEQVTNEMLSLQLIYTHPKTGAMWQAWVKHNLSWDSGRERAAELIRLFHLKDDQGQENFRTREWIDNENRRVRFVEDLPGKFVDVVLDDVYWKGGYLNRTVRGYFLNGSSWQEIAHGVNDHGDVNRCMNACHMKGFVPAIPEGEPLPWQEARKAQQAEMSKPLPTAREAITAPAAKPAKKTAFQKEAQAQAEFYKGALADMPKATAPAPAPAAEVPPPAEDPDIPF